ncbi:hypothetical protein [Streptomyces coeruleorubidus]|uniref:hypothetical protein n=1 Tax=Streptomyces coeruleorubidus TaxID=116188 RepID=UPI0036D1265D
MTGRLGDRYGKRRMLLISLVMLVAGSVTAALSDSLAPMITGRADQGPGHDRHVHTGAVARTARPVPRLVPGHRRAVRWVVIHITLHGDSRLRTGIRCGPPIRKDPLSTAFPQLRGGLPQCGGARIRTWEG